MKLFIAISYLLTSLISIYLFKDYLGYNFFSAFLLLFILSLFFQVVRLNQNDPKNCLTMFKLNNFSGLCMFLGILMIGAI